MRKWIQKDLDSIKRDQYPTASNIKRDLNSTKEQDLMSTEGDILPITAAVYLDSVKRDLHSTLTTSNIQRDQYSTKEHKRARFDVNRRLYSTDNCCYIPLTAALYSTMGWLRLVGCLKIYVSLQNIGLFCRSLLQKRPIFLSILLIIATPN